MINNGKIVIKIFLKHFVFNKFQPQFKMKLWQGQYVFPV